MLGCFNNGPVQGMCADALLSKAGDFEVWSLKPAATAGRRCRLTWHAWFPA